MKMYDLNIDETKRFVKFMSELPFKKTLKALVNVLILVLPLLFLYWVWRQLMPERPAIINNYYYYLK